MSPVSDARRSPFRNFTGCRSSLESLLVGGVPRGDPRGDEGGVDAGCGGRSKFKLLQIPSQQL